MFSVIIAGSRTITLTVEDIDRAIAELDPSGLLWVPGEWTEIVCGGADGVDLSGKAWGEVKGIAVHPEPITREDISRHGKYLGPKMRNRRMAERADGALIFWDGRSGGSADMCCRMVARRKPVEVIPWAPRRRRHDEPSAESLVEMPGINDQRFRRIPGHGHLSTRRNR